MDEFVAENTSKGKIEPKYLEESLVVQNRQGETDRMLHTHNANEKMQSFADTVNMASDIKKLRQAPEDLSKDSRTRKSASLQETTLEQSHEHAGAGALTKHVDVSLAEEHNKCYKCILPQGSACEQMHGEKLVSGSVSSESLEHKHTILPENAQNDIGESSPILSGCLAIDQPILNKELRRCQEDASNSQTMNGVSPEDVSSLQMKEFYSGKVLAPSPSQSDQLAYEDPQTELADRSTDSSKDILFERRRPPQEITNNSSLVENLACFQKNATENPFIKELGANSECAGEESTAAQVEIPSINASKSYAFSGSELGQNSEGGGEVPTYLQFEALPRKHSKNSAHSGHEERRNSKSLKKKYLLRSLVKSERVLRSRSQEKPKALESKNKSTDASTGGETRKKTRKRRGKRIEENEYSRIRKHLRYLLHRMSYEKNLIDAYSSEGWKGLSLEKLKPEKELQRAKDEINRCKLKIRELFQHIDLLNAEGRLPESIFDSEGEIYSEDIFCAKCGSKDVTLDNDIILCDGACDRGFHQHCLEPPLLKEDIPSGDEGWLCPGCDCKVDCIDLINDSQGTNLSVTDCWEKVFPEAAGGEQDDNAELPSDDSDNDYNPDGPDTDEDGSEIGSTTDESDYASASEGLEAPPQDKKYLKLSSDDSEDDDYDPDAPENDVNSKEQSSSSDFTSASEDLGAAIDSDKSSSEDEGPMSSSLDGVRPLRGSKGHRSKMAARKTSLKDELASLQEKDPGQEGSETVSRRRHVERLDYKKLYDETYGNVPSESSDDEDWRDVTAPKRIEAGNVASMSPEGNTPDRAKMNSEIKHSRKRAGHTSKRASQKMKMDNMDNSRAELNKGSPLPGSSGKRSRPSTHNRLGEAVTKRMYESFKENQYPDRATKESLAKELGLTLRQVSKWFENARWSSRHSASWDASVNKYASGKNSTAPQKYKQQVLRKQEMVSCDRDIGDKEMVTPETCNQKRVTRNSCRMKSKSSDPDLDSEVRKPLDDQPQASGVQTNGKPPKRRRKNSA